MTASQLHHHLLALRAERACASLDGLTSRPYLDDLLAEIEATRRAFVLAAVTEIAHLRAALDRADLEEMTA